VGDVLESMARHRVVVRRHGKVAWLMATRGRCIRAASLLLAGWLSVTTTLAAQHAIPSGTIQTGVLSFDGRGTVGDFTGTTSTMTGRLVGAADLPAVRGWVEAPVKTLLTGNGKRDKDLNKSMESEKYPTIRFDLTGVAPRAARGDTVAVTLLGTFHIHGVIRPACGGPGTYRSARRGRLRRRQGRRAAAHRRARIRRRRCWRAR
jgi:polyisoprenoid-binding protein YceI